MKSLTKTLTSVCLLFTLLGTAVPANAATYSSISEQLVSLSEVIANLQSQMMGRVLGASISNGLVAEYEFESGSGSTVIDTVGTNDGVIDGATWSSGYSGGGLLFDGVDDVVNTDFDPGGLDAFTVAFWMKPIAFNGREGVVASYNSGIFIAFNNGQWQFTVGGPSGEICKIRKGSVMPDINSWNFMALSYNGSECATHYQGAYSTHSAQASQVVNDGGLYFGRGNTFYSDSWFDGWIDNVYVYDRALSQSELNNLAADEPTSGSDVEPEPEVIDGDDDGVEDSSDNCPDIANTEQGDADGDGVGDVCDSTPNGETASDTDPVLETNDVGVYYSEQDLGWSAGQEIGPAIRTFFSDTAEPGGTLIFEDFYTLTVDGSSIGVPQGFTLAGAYYGAGFDIQDYGPVSGTSEVIRLADETMLYNLTVTMSDTPSDVDYYSGRIFELNGDDIQIINTKIDGDASHLTRGVFSRLLVKDSHFIGGYWSNYWDFAQDTSVVDTLFQESYGDGIKGGGDNLFVTGSVFINNGRDGIDTVSGFRNSLIENSYFIGNFKGLDIKSLWDQNDTAPLNRLSSVNENITIRNTEFIGDRGVAAITLDRGDANGSKWVTSENADSLLTQNVNIYDSTFRKAPGSCINGMNLIDVHSVNWNNIVLSADCGQLVNISRNSVQSSAVDTSVQTNYNLSGTNVTEIPAETYEGDDYFMSLVGPNQSLTYQAGDTIDNSIPDPGSDTQPSDTTSDSDSDNVADDVDNCPTTANANQTDTDGDGIGDACDATPNGDVTAPTISAVTTSNIGETNATISWSTDELATSEVLYGTDSSYGDTTNETNTVTRSHTETLTGLNADTTYHFQVKSRDAAGNSAASQDLTFTTLSAPDTTSPTVTLTEPGNGATVSDVITISADATDPSASGQSVTGVASVAFSVDGTTLATDTSAPYDTGLDTTTLGDGTYTITAVATDGAGNTNTDTVSVTVENVTEPPADTTAPAISFLSNEATNNDPITHVITYTTNEPTTATLRFGTNRNNLNTDVESATLTTTHTFTLEGLSNKQTYHFALTATDAAGNSATSDTDSFRTIGKPQKVQNLTARSGSVILEWELPGNVEAIDEVVVIRRNGGAQGRTSDEPLVTLEPAATTYTDESANMERQYTYTVYTISDNEYSDPVSVTFKKEPGAPELTPEAAAEAEAEESRRSSGGGGGSSRNRSDSNSTRVPASVPATTVAAPNSIITTDNLNVRVTPGGTLIRMVPQGTSGTKLSDAPVQQGGYTWIRVNFAGGTAGWVAQEFIRTNSSSTLTPERRAALLQQIRMLLMQIVQLQTALNAMR